MPSSFVGPSPDLVGPSEDTLLTVEETITSTDVPPVENVTKKGRSIYAETPALYAYYYVHNRYELDGHKYMAGITSPSGFKGQSAAFFKLATSTLLWISDWTCATIAEMPYIPDPTAVDSNWELLDAHAELNDVQPLPDGVTPTFGVTGTYVYGHKNPDTVIWNNAQFGLSPEYAQGVTRAVPLSSLKGGIISPTGTVTGGDNVSPGSPSGGGDLAIKPSVTQFGSIQK